MQKSIDIMQNKITKVLFDSKPTIYLYGSVVLDDFKFGWSDIDILCLTEKSISIEQAEELVNLRQTLMEKYTDNPYFRSFEGGILSLKEFLNNKKNRVVYWGTSGQRITDNYVFDVFSKMELKDNGRLLCGNDIRSQIKYPTKFEQIEAIKAHYNIIRKYAVETDNSLYSAGWLLDIARCLYTLQTGKIIGKTDAGEWAISNNIVPDIKTLRRALVIRKNPVQYKKDAETMEWLTSLGPNIQEFADVLEKQIYIKEHDVYLC